MVRHPHHVCWLLHQMRVFYDRFSDEYGGLPADALAIKREQREVVHRLDNLAFRQVRHIFTNGSETARRLQFYNGFKADVCCIRRCLPAVIHVERKTIFCCPGGCIDWKRVRPGDPRDAARGGRRATADRAAGRARSRVPSDWRVDPRIRFLGFLGDAALVELYANALGVLFVPKDEDFGYITVEAMLSHKPVIVCKDSGEPRGAGAAR